MYFAASKVCGFHSGALANEDHMAITSMQSCCVESLSLFASCLCGSNTAVLAASHTGVGVILQDCEHTSIGGAAYYGLVVQ
jgi:hypothetical protein